MPTWGQIPTDARDIESFFLQAAAAEATGADSPYKAITVAGELPNLGVLREEIQDQGGATTLPTVAAPIDLLSTSVNDTAAGGTGARVVLVTGLLDGFSSGSTAQPYFEETVALTGTVPGASTVNSFLRVQRIIVVDAGSTRQNEGVLTASIGGALQAQVSIAAIGAVGHGVSKTSHFSIPAGWSGFISRLFFTWSGNQPLAVFCAFRQGSTTSYPFTAQFATTTVTNTNVLPFPSGTDGWCEGARVGGGGIDPADVIFRLLLARNPT